ncbi:MAG: FAD-dependent monooxygenase [Candidatus Dormibacteraceae bacterium]
MNDLKGLRVGIAGGSLAGLSAAPLLTDLGCEVTVYERSAAQLEGRGAGIVVHAMTVKYLQERRALRPEQLATRVSQLVYLGPDDQVVHEEPCIWSFTSWNTLYRALRGCVDDERFRLGRALTGFEMDSDGVSVTFGGGQRERFDLLVGADGIASTTRGILFPDLHPSYSGYVAWRGTVDEWELSPPAAALLGDAVVYHLMPHSHLLTYPIPSVDGSTDRGRRPINFVWYRNVRAGPDLDDLMTDQSGSVHQLSLPPGALREVHLQEFRRAAQSLPSRLAEIVLRTAQPFLQPIVDVEVPRMAVGRTCLIGDAAFVARPHAAAGTAKAAADGWALAAALQGMEGDLPGALERWQQEQLALGRQLVARVRDVGDRSQFGSGWQPQDMSLRFGLYAPGD